jgi:photosystem II stability/assembly factor-like uncharacterized protein
MKKINLTLSAILFSAVAATGQTPGAIRYRWQNVQIVGGGFVDGVIFHPSEKDLRYARTDMGGAYRWDARSRRWQPMLDWVPYKDLNLMGVESIALDPSDTKRVYLACGTYSNPRTPNGAILRSDDRGTTFERTDVPFKFGGNEDGRGNGERLAVDPGDGRVLYLGTRHDGLWRSSDRGVTWSHVVSFPDIQEAIAPAPAAVPGETPEEHYRQMPVRGDGIVFVQYAPQADELSTHAPTQTIYVGVSLMNRPNLFVSHDAGQSWHAIAREPTLYRPERAALSRDGFLYVAYGAAPGPSRMVDGAVWKLNTRDDTWEEITPDRPVLGSKAFGYAGISVDAQHPQSVIASSFGRPASAGGDDIFRSSDGGRHWTPIFGSGGRFDYGLAPYVKSTPIHWLFDIEIDPLNPDHATFTTGYGGWETLDLTAADHGQPTHWSILASGIEETVGLALDSPAKGVSLISGIGDYGGFVHADLDHPTPAGSAAPPRFANTTDVVSAALRPEVIVRVGSNAEHRPDANLSYSEDGGRTWQGSAATPAPGSRSGTLSVGADGTAWVWSPQHMSAYLTQDRGQSWTLVKGLATGLRVVADPVDPKLFYAISLKEQMIYRSIDGGANFSAEAFKLSDGPAGLKITPRADERGGQDRIYPEPGRSGELWFAAFDGLYHATLESAPQDVLFERMPGVDEIHAFGLGKAAPHYPSAALYLVGTVAGQPGIFRSIDDGQNWERINDDAHQWGLVLQISGDPKRYGRVYVGTHGRGIFYGDPQ